jgi:hypothetical protein
LKKKKRRITGLYTLAVDCAINMRAFETACAAIKRIGLRFEKCIKKHVDRLCKSEYY